MGFVVSKFRNKKKTTGEQLESIDQQIRKIEKFQKETEQRFRRVVGKFLILSIVIYVVILIGYYYYFSPDTFRKNIVKFIPLLVLPVLILFSRRLLSWYYTRKLTRNESTLKILKADKKKLLEEVMDKETYKKAKEILEKYAPEQLSSEPVKMTANTPSKLAVSVTPDKPHLNARQRLPITTPATRRPCSNGHPAESAFQPIPSTPSLAQPRLSLPRPILQRDRGPFDKLIDMIIGDGPTNRYALICRVCSSHNGMALKHEFEYLAFRCAYCLQWNPARKQKPQAPNLMSDSGSQNDSDTSHSDEENKSMIETLTSAEHGIDSPQVIEKYTEKQGSKETTNENCPETSVKKTNLKDSEDCPEGTDDEETKVPVLSSNVDLSELRQALKDIENELPVAASSPVTEAFSQAKSEQEDPL